MIDVLRAVEHVHGHLGWLAVVALAHPAYLLRRPRRAPVAVGLATGLVTVGAALGMWLYVGYRAQLKRVIFTESPAMGLLFERKEHLAFAAVLLAWAGCAAYVAAPRFPALQPFAFRAYVAACVLACAVAVLGTIVATHRTF